MLSARRRHSDSSSENKWIANIYHLSLWYTGAPARLSIPMVRDARDVGLTWDLLTRPDECARFEISSFSSMENPHLCGSASSLTPDGLSCSLQRAFPLPSSARGRRRDLYSCLETFIPLSPSCRAIIQVETRSMRSRCSMPFFGVRPPMTPLCSRRPHRTFILRFYRSRHRAGRSFKSRRAFCAHGPQCPS